MDGSHDDGSGLNAGLTRGVDLSCETKGRGITPAPFFCSGGD
jgi:hypothetical protein